MAAMGFIEETGAAQYLRDARIAPIYEGTTGIQAGDLVGRKLSMDNGSAMTELIEEMRVVRGPARGLGQCGPAGNPRKPRRRHSRVGASQPNGFSRRSDAIPRGARSFGQLHDADGLCLRRLADGRAPLSSPPGRG